MSKFDYGTAAIELAFEELPEDAEYTTVFSRALVRANIALVKALEADGTEMHKQFNIATIYAKVAEDMAYEHSVGEKIAAANLINTINTIKAVCV